MNDVFYTLALTASEIRTVGKAMGFIPKDPRYTEYMAVLIVNNLTYDHEYDLARKILFQLTLQGIDTKKYWMRAFGDTD